LLLILSMIEYTELSSPPLTSRLKMFMFPLGRAPGSVPAVFH
jgi:hypothetical protein